MYSSDSKSMEDYKTKGWTDPSDGECMPQCKRCRRMLHVHACVCFLSQDYATYRVSKMGVCRLTELQAETIGKDPARPGILINSVSTGYHTNLLFCIHTCIINVPIGPVTEGW